MIKTKNISEMLTSLIEEYRFNKNTLSKYLEITEETIDGVVMGNVECLLDDPALRLKILSKAGFLYFGAIEDKDRQLSGFLEVLVSYHGISKLTIAKMSVMAALALMVTTMATNRSCMWYFGQDKMPEDSKKLRRF